MAARVRVLENGLPEKGRKEREEIVEEMKERTGKKEERGTKVEETEEIKHSPST